MFYEYGPRPLAQLLHDKMIMTKSMGMNKNYHMITIVNKHGDLHSKYTPRTIT